MKTPGGGLLACRREGAFTVSSQKIPDRGDSFPAMKTAERRVDK